MDTSKELNASVAIRQQVTYLQRTRIFEFHVRDKGSIPHNVTIISTLYESHTKQINRCERMNCSGKPKFPFSEIRNITFLTCVRIYLSKEQQQAQRPDTFLFIVVDIVNRRTKILTFYLKVGLLKHSFRLKISDFSLLIILVLIPSWFLAKTCSNRYNVILDLFWTNFDPLLCHTLIVTHPGFPGPPKVLTVFRHLGNPTPDFQ